MTRPHSLYVSERTVATFASTHGQPAEPENLMWISVRKPRLVADRKEKGWSSERQPFPLRISPNGYTRGDLPSARCHCTIKASGAEGLNACTTPAKD